MNEENHKDFYDAHLINYIWKDDLLDRRTDAETILRFLESRVEERRALGQTASFVLNIDSAWGNGKTFFLERFQQHIEYEGHKAAYVNAWESDHAPDPLIAVISRINDEFDVVADAEEINGEKVSLKEKWGIARKAAAPVAMAAIKGGAKSFLTRYLGSEIGEVIKEHLKSDDTSQEDIKADAKETDVIVGSAVSGAVDAFFNDALSEHKTAKESIEGFRNALGQLMDEQVTSKGKQKLLFVLIDELDRCRPTYAIEMLETIKHLFDAENVVFVVATDLNQLTKAIPVVYGNKFDANRYLNRFFDMSYQFDEVDISKISVLLARRFEAHIDKISLLSGYSLEDTLCDAYSSYDLPLRDFFQCFENVISFVAVWDSKHKVNIYFALLVAMWLKGKKENQMLENYYSDTSSYALDRKIKFIDICSYSLRAVDRKLIRAGRNDSDRSPEYWYVEYMLVAEHNDGNPEFSRLRGYEAAMKRAGKFIELL